jgi:hypothetical protein
MCSFQHHKPAFKVKENSKRSLFFLDRQKSVAVTFLIGALYLNGTMELFCSQCLFHEGRNL